MSKPTLLTFRSVGPGSDEVVVNTADIARVRCVGADPRRTDERLIVVHIRAGLLEEAVTVYRGHEPAPLLHAIKNAIGAPRGDGRLTR